MWANDTLTRNDQELACIFWEFFASVSHSGTLRPFSQIHIHILYMPDLAIIAQRVQPHILRLSILMECNCSCRNAWSNDCWSVRQPFYPNFEIGRKTYWLKQLARNTTPSIIDKSVWLQSAAKSRNVSSALVSWPTWYETVSWTMHCMYKTDLH